MKHCGLESCARMGVRFFALAGIVTALVEPVYKLFLHLYSWAADRKQKRAARAGIIGGARHSTVIWIGEQRWGTTLRIIATICILLAYVFLLVVWMVKPEEAR